MKKPRDHLDLSAKHLNAMRLSQNAANDLWSLRGDRPGTTPAMRKRALEYIVRAALEEALDLPSTVDGHEGDPDNHPMLNPFSGSTRT